MKAIRGSLTVEAAMILPLVLLVFALAMNGGIQLYLEFKEVANSISEEEEIHVIHWFYNWETLKDIIE